MAKTPANKIIYTAIDFETTGTVAGWDNKPWQIGMCEVFGEGRVGRTYSSFLEIDLNRPFNEYAPGRHAQIREVLAESPGLPEIWDVVSPWLVQKPLIAHNIGTERTILRSAAPLSHLGPWIDTLKLSRYVYPNLRSYALEDLIVLLELKEKIDTFCPNLAPHDALYDAVACGQLFLHFLSLPGWESVAIEDLSRL